MPRVLILDIETAPAIAFIWGIWKENIGTNQVIDSGYVLSWSAKWLGERDTRFDAVWKSSPRDVLKGIHDLLDEADIVVHYNGKNFDIPTLNKEFIKHGFFPPRPFKQVDLFHFVKKQLRFLSNKLDFVTQSLGLGGKIRHPGFELWVKAMGFQTPERPLTKKEILAARRLMERYNKRDVRLTEALYTRVRPWIQQHPNFSAFTDGEVCPFCGGKHLQRRGEYTTKMMRYPRFQCQDCGGWSRGNKTVSRHGASRLSPAD